MQRETDKQVLEAIKKHNMIFISAQPDQIYFHWQVSLYLYQFAKHGIIDQCYVLFSYTTRPSEWVKKLMKKNPNVKAYKDTRTYKRYQPTIRPHLLHKFFLENPKLGKNVFYHDSDIFLVKLPRFDLMLEDDNAYLSDTINYIGYEYIKKCSKRYKEIHTQLPDEDIFNKMCEAVGIDKELVKSNEKNSGGAQYLLKNIDAQFWKQCELSCKKLYDMFYFYEKKYNIENHIQKWCTDMWCVLWNYWKSGKKTLIHKELDFSWAIDNIEKYNSRNIFHLAGVTDKTESDKFRKQKYYNKLIFDSYISNPTIFDYINKDNATYKYIEEMKEYVMNVHIKEKNMNPSIIEKNIESIRNLEKFKKLDSKITKYTIYNKEAYAGTYIENNRLCCNKKIWISQNKKYLIFWNEKCWVLTYYKYLNEIGKGKGGIIFNHSEDITENEWNAELKITFS
jgi:hypothetical protein